MEIGLSEHFTYKKLARFTIPTIIMMLFTSLYGIVDGLFISNIAGEDAFASVNLMFPAVMILASFGFMIGAGGSALVSKTLGEGNSKKASEYFSLLIYLQVIVGCILGIIGIFNIESIALMLKATPEMMADCKTYAIVLLIFTPFFMLQNCFQSFLIVAEKPKLGLYVIVAAGVTNIILDFVFIYLFQMGVLGAGIATGIGQLVASLIPLSYFIFSKEAIIKIGKTKFEIWPILKSCGNGSSEMVTNLSLSFVSMLFNVKLMELVGSDGVIAYGIIMYVGFIFVAVFLGYSIGVSQIVAYHYGAKNEIELKNLFKKSLCIITVTSLILSIAAQLCATPMAKFFVGYDDGLVAMTTSALRLYSLSFLVLGINIFASAFFTALNDGFISALISFLRTLIFQIITIMIMPILWGITGLWLSTVISEVISIVVSIICFIMLRKKYNYA